ncbi:DUF5995 family protein [Kitasatospora sp. NPDC093558]|uniref:DUF5995 family protein n=1 Tax=Kitasatospora sp. NPDC093558 TaxID=3155201 RepID=UPI003436AAD9
MTGPTADGGTPADRVARVAGLLERRVAAYDRDRDHRAVFAYLYLCLTRDLERGLRSGRPAFDDPGWIALLSGRLAMTYLRTQDAIDTWLATATDRPAHPRPGDLPDTVPPPWRDVYAASSAERSYVLEEIVFSMAAHLSYDLPLTLLALAGPGPADPHAHIADFDRMNALLGSSVESVQDHVAARYCRGLLTLEHLCTRDERLLTARGIEAFRADAWFNFDRLSDPVAAATARRAIPRITADIIREFRAPADPNLRLATHLLRLLVPARRQWPPPDGQPGTVHRPTR